LALFKGLREHELLNSKLLSALIPALGKSGLLPPGMHYATWNELIKMFGVNRHRLKLLDGLKKGLNILIEYGCKEFCINGSFVTVKPLPADIDVCYDNTPMNWKKFIQDHPEFIDINNGASTQKQKYYSEFYAYNAFEDAALIRFQFDRDGSAKGIVKLTLLEIIP
jgi:hypothetical protein